MNQYIFIYFIYGCTYFQAVYNKTYISVKKGTTGLLCADQIDMETWFFPVCMKRLHAKLRKHHRLKHHSRVNYKSQFYLWTFIVLKWI